MLSFYRFSHKRLYTGRGCGLLEKLSHGPHVLTVKKAGWSVILRGYLTEGRHSRKMEALEVIVILTIFQRVPNN